MSIHYTGHHHILRFTIYDLVHLMYFLNDEEEENYSSIIHQILLGYPDTNNKMYVYIEFDCDLSIKDYWYGGCK